MAICLVSCCDLSCHAYLTHQGWHSDWLVLSKLPVSPQTVDSTFLNVFLDGTYKKSGIIYSVLLYANSSGDNKVPDLLSSSKMRPYLSVYHILLNVSVSVFSDSLQSKSSLELFCLFQLLTLLTLWLPVCWLAWIDGLLNPAPERRLTNHSIATVTRKGLSSFWFLHMPWEFFFYYLFKTKNTKNQL